MSLVLESRITTPPARSPITVLRQQLRASPYWSIRQLVCDIDQNRIIVRGTVTSFYLKQIAQSLAANVVGIACVQSEIDVQPESASTAK
jgi:hypothetical protein